MAAASVLPRPPAARESEAGSRWAPYIAALALGGIAAHLVPLHTLHASEAASAWPLLITLAGGGLPLVLQLGVTLARHDLGSDLLAGIAIVVSVILGEHLAGAFVVSWSCLTRSAGGRRRGRGPRGDGRTRRVSPPRSSSATDFGA